MKATALTPLSLEYFEDLGVFERVRATGTAVRDVAVYADGTEALRRSWDGLDSPHPYLLLLGQQYTEAILHERLRELGAAVEWRTELTGFEVAPEGVAVTVAAEARGSRETSFARFLAGCDGARSAVARQLGTEYRQHDYSTDYVVAEIEIDAKLDRRDWSFFFTPAGILAAGAMPKNRWGIMATLPKREGRVSWLDKAPSVAELQAIWDERSPFPGKLGNPQWISHYRTHLKSARGKTRWPVVLAGDAAHQVSPLSAMGMNSGILDARNLAWRLDLACRGLAGAEILSSYDFEHRREWSSAAALTRLNEMAYPWTAGPLRAYRDWSLRVLMNIDSIWRFYVRFQTQKDRNLRRSPIVKQDVGGPVHRLGAPHLSDHTTCLAAWLAFGEGPHAGDQWRDVPGLIDPAVGEEIRLFNVVFGGQHTLLVFGGCDEPSDEMRMNFRDLESQCARLPAGLVKVAFIHHGAAIPRKAWAGTVLLDPLGAAHARYGAEGEALYLMRPDGFIAYRAQPPQPAPLANFLRSYFGKIQD